MNFLSVNLIHLPFQEIQTAIPDKQTWHPGWSIISMTFTKFNSVFCQCHWNCIHFIASLSLTVPKCRKFQHRIAKAITELMWKNTQNTKLNMFCDSLQLHTLVRSWNCVDIAGTFDTSPCLTALKCWMSQQKIPEAADYIIWCFTFCWVSGITLSVWFKKPAS